MAETIRIGALGLTHDHIWGLLDELMRTPDGELVAVADPNQPLLDRAARDYGCATYLDYEQLLDHERLDAAYVFSDNAASVPLTVQAAGRGLHVMVEKPLAATLEGADRMLDAARENDARIMVNWPYAWWPYIQRALDLAASGAVGEIRHVKYRGGHRGPREEGCSEFFCEWLFDAERNGAGALMDYCCYGANLACVLLGPPTRSTAVTAKLRDDDLGVEDNAVMIMSYPKAMATAEASWSQIGKPTAYMAVFHGTGGTILADQTGSGRVVVATAEDLPGREVEIPAPPPHLSGGTAHFLWALTTGEPFTPLCGAEPARDAQAALEQAIQAAS